MKGKCARIQPVRDVCGGGLWFSPGLLKLKEHTWGRGWGGWEGNSAGSGLGLRAHILWEELSRGQAVQGPGGPVQSS